MNYHFFNKYVLRTPIFSIGQVFKLFKDDVISDDSILELCQDPVISEAIFVASPDFHKELVKWQLGEIESKAYSERIKTTFLKYYLRMGTRCVPFGLFASVSLGYFDDITSIEMKKSGQFRRTFFDMGILSGLKEILIKDEAIREYIKFYMNSSIYKVGNQWRYIEVFNGDKKQIHQISAVVSSEELEHVFHYTKTGATISELANLLKNSAIELENAKDFIDELIENQVLVSEFEPLMSGKEYQVKINEVLVRIPSKPVLWKELLSQLQVLDLNKVNKVEDYNHISKRLAEDFNGLERPIPFHVIQGQDISANLLDKKLLPKIRKILTLYNRISLTENDSQLSNFKQKFKKRYGYRQVEFAKVTDVDTGLRYDHFSKTGSMETFVDDLILPKKVNHSNYLDWNRFHEMLNMKLIKFLKGNDTKLTIYNSDVKHMDANWNDLPDTFSGLVELFVESGTEKLYIPGFGGTSAANQLSRFGVLNEQIFELAREIADTEQIMNPNLHLCEISHNPGSKVSNALTRPTLRDFEIPYLAKSELPYENQVFIKDLLISIDKNDRLILRSKRLDKAIEPKNTNAHKITGKHLPAYQLLSQLQLQGKRKKIGFDWGPIRNLHSFLPRVEYEGVVLSKAQWKLKNSNMTMLYQFVFDESELLTAASELCVAIGIPKIFQLIDGDNTLLVNLGNVNSIRVMLSEVRTLTEFWIEEFVFSEGSPVKCDGDFFSNQLQICLFNNQKLNHAT